MVFKLKDFQIEIIENKIKKIYFNDKLLFTEVNFFGYQNKIVREILIEKKYNEYILEEDFKIKCFEKFDILYKKDKYITLKGFEKNLRKKFDLIFEINFKIDKNDLVLEINYKTSKRIFWFIDILLKQAEPNKIHFENIEENQFVYKNKEKNIFIKDEENFEINPFIQVVNRNISIRSSYENFRKNKNELIFSSKITGKKTEILKVNQSYITNHNFHVLRLKSNT